VLQDVTQGLNYAGCSVFMADGECTGVQCKQVGDSDQLSSLSCRAALPALLAGE